MPLSAGRLKERILAALDDYDTITPEDKGSARADFADKLSEAIVAEIKNLTITYTTGLVTPSGSVTGVFNNIIT